MNEEFKEPRGFPWYLLAIFLLIILMFVSAYFAQQTGNPNVKPEPLPPNHMSPLGTP